MLAIEQETVPDAWGKRSGGWSRPTRSACEVAGKRRHKRQFRFKGSANAAARFLLSSLEGALMTARAFHDTGRFEATTRWNLETLIV